MNSNRAVATLAKLRTTEGTLELFHWKHRWNRGNPVHCKTRTYKSYIMTRDVGRINVGYYCRKCGAKLKLNGEEEKQQP